MWREVALHTSDTCCSRYYMQTGAESNLDNPTPVSSPYASSRSEPPRSRQVVHRRVSTSEHESFNQRCARSNLCALPRILGAIMGATGFTANVSLLRKRGSDMFKRTYVLFPVDLALLWVGAPTGMVVWYGKVWVAVYRRETWAGGKQRGPGGASV